MPKRSTAITITATLFAGFYAASTFSLEFKNTHTGVGPLTPAAAAFVNAILCMIVAIGETSLFAPRIFEKKLRYENIHNIRPENYHLLVADVTQRTGLNVTNIEITDIDFLSDVANLQISYSETKQSD